MATQAELLADVIATPFSDAPRRAYADHLEAQPGGPSVRAEFIRLQLRLATERFDQPSSGNDNAETIRRMRYLAAQREERRLAEQHTQTWAADVLRMAQRVHYHRGFVASVVADAARFIRYGAWLMQRAPVVHVELRGVGQALDALVACPALAQVRALSLGGQGLDDDALRRLLGSPHLGRVWWLELGNNAIGMPGLHALAGAGLPGLRYVGLRGNAVDPHETAGVHGNLIQDVALPPEGEALEAKHGPLPWLHFSSESMLDFPPSPHGESPP